MYGVTQKTVAPAKCSNSNSSHTMFPITHLLCRPGGLWDTTEAYVFNASTFTKYHVQLALALKLYVTDRDNDGAPLPDQTISDILTDLKQHTERVDCSNLKAQVEEEHAELLREVEERKERWTADAQELYQKWYLKAQPTSNVPEGSA